MFDGEVFSVISFSAWGQCGDKNPPAATGTRVSTLVSRPSCSYDSFGLFFVYTVPGVSIRGIAILTSNSLVTVGSTYPVLPVFASIKNGQQWARARGILQVKGGISGK